MACWAKHTVCPETTQYRGEGAAPTGNLRIMNKHERQVRKFYDVIWNQHDKTEVPNVLHEGFRFRGSLGQEKLGHRGFIEYVDMVHQALANYECVIEDLVCEPGKVFTKMRFSGIHQGEFLGYAPTQKTVSWAGCALFTFEGDKVSDLWVLGDLKSLEHQLKANQG